MSRTLVYRSLKQYNMNKDLIARKFARASSSYLSEAKVQHIVARELLSLIERYSTKELERVVEVGCGTGLFTRLLLSKESPKFLLLNDICKEMEATLSDVLCGSNSIEFRAFDADSADMALPTELDLIVSASALQWFTDPKGFFQRCATSLQRGGLIAISTFAPDNLFQIAELTNTTLPYPTLEELRGYLEPHFDILELRDSEVTLTFPTPVDSLKHLKQTGVNAIEPQRWTKGKLAEFSKEYIEKFSTDSGINLTYRPIYIVAKPKE